MRLLMLVGCLLWMTACAENPIGPTDPFEAEFTVAPGQVGAIEGTPFRVEFLEVTGDSRCPADAMCILGGDAIVHLSVVGDGAPRRYELHTGDASQASVTHRSVTITLVELQPFPFSSRTIEQHEYRATLRVTRP